ncbi:hypothetical protein [Spiroplasma endosymbiont of Cleonymus obscurus]|uniref:hypothetical protein n=1 Tax=Spiroplasma endosymbiont of Cleonymus obscurus TaxID=3066324 RepID=UPI0037DD9596
MKLMVTKELFKQSTVSKFSRLFSLISKVIFGNPRTYIFVFLLGFLISALSSWLWNNYSYYQILPPILLNFLSISVFISSFYLGIFMIEWRKKNFLKRIKIIGINEYYIILTIFLSNLIMVSLSVSINIICYNIYSLISIFNFHLNLLSNIRWFIWIFYIFVMILLTFFLTVANIFITTFFSKFNLSFVMLAIFTIFFIIFSDVLIQPTVTNNNLIFIVIGYLCPTKYFIWFNMLITSYQFLDSLGISQIIQNYNEISFVVFTSIWQTLIGILIFTMLFSYLSKRFFNWGMKG